jgi:glutathione S-transferase
LSLTLYYHPLSSFCHKVLVALYENGTEFERRIINLGDDKDRAELLAVSPIGKFPAVRDHVRKRNLAETTIIIEYLDHFFAGERPLIPREWEDALQVRLWDRLFDNYVQVPMQQIVGDRMRGAKGDLARERATLDTAYAMIDKQVADSTWVAGRNFSVADCAAAPALFYAGTVHSFPQSFPHLRAYFDRLMERPSVQRVMEEAKPYFPLFPFADAIPKRFC